MTLRLKWPFDPLPILSHSWSLQQFWNIFTLEHTVENTLESRKSSSGYFVQLRHRLCHTNQILEAWNESILSQSRRNLPKDIPSFPPLPYLSSQTSSASLFQLPCTLFIMHALIHLLLSIHKHLVDHPLVLRHGASCCSTVDI